MAKIQNDKYYTPSDIAEYIVSKTKEIIGENNISEYIEPSAGAGVFLDYLDKPYTAYDIEPEDNRIIKQDFLTVELGYKQGRCIITNPPFGSRMNMVQKFYKKSIEIADYISFILPISQLNNNQTMYEFDLVYSEDLGVKHYSDCDLHCCFNIYKRPVNGFNPKPNYKLKDISIIRQDSKIYNEIKNYDLRMCYWGDGTAGKILYDDNERYAGEYKFIIHNTKHKNNIISVLSNYDWKSEIDRIAMRRIKQWQIIKVLKEKIPELQ